jgi:signal transduction histidine kinase
VFIAALCALVWLLSGLGTFWPGWVWLPLALSVALHLAAVRFVNADDRPQRLRAAAEAEMATVLFLVGLWAAAGGGAFWPLWPAVTIAVIHGGVVLALAAPWRERGELTERVAVLTRTRRDAVDAQAEQLRQIERDLHDGAQARLVALSMQLGRAESRLADRPEEAELLRLAREEAGAAIAELRDLARGIAPPILVDRGLAAAVDALGRRASLKVTLVSDLTARQSPAVEGCAYFVCAEALTNAAKHAPQAEVEIQLTKQEGKLLVIVKDDGPGGADSGGSGLTGLRQRVAALDGTLTVGTVSGEGTTIRAELPCES